MNDIKTPIYCVKNQTYIAQPNKIETYENLKLIYEKYIEIINIVEGKLYFRDENTIKYYDLNNDLITAHETGIECDTMQIKDIFPQKCLLLKEKEGVCSLYNYSDKTSMEIGKIEDYKFTSDYFYFLTVNWNLCVFNYKNKKIKNIESSVSAFDTEQNKLYVGYRSGAMNIDGVYLHWHNRPVRSIKAAFGSVYSCSTKKVVHCYSLGTKKMCVLFEFKGVLVCIIMVESLLFLKTTEKIYIYDLKYEEIVFEKYL